MWTLTIEDLIADMISPFPLYLTGWLIGGIVLDLIPTHGTQPSPSLGSRPQMPITLSRYNRHRNNENIKCCIKNMKYKQNRK